MPPQLRAVFDLWLLWIPYAESAIRRACGYKMSCRVPCYGFNAVRPLRIRRVGRGDGGRTCVSLGHEMLDHDMTGL